MKNIVKVAVTEANEILHNAREARDRGEIDQRKFDEITQSCYRACMEALAERLAAQTAAERGQASPRVQGIT